MKFAPDTISPEFPVDLDASELTESIRLHLRRTGILIPDGIPSMDIHVLEAEGDVLFDIADHYDTARSLAAQGVPATLAPLSETVDMPTQIHALATLRFHEAFVEAVESIIATRRTYDAVPAVITELLAGERANIDDLRTALLACNSDIVQPYYAGHTGLSTPKLLFFALSERIAHRNARVRALLNTLPETGARTTILRVRSALRAKVPVWMNELRLLCPTDLPESGGPHRLEQ